MTSGNGRKLGCGEYHENEIRKNFTPEERVHIGRAVEERLGDRQRQRTDKLVEKVPQVEPGAKTRETAAKHAGFGNDRTYRQAKEIVEAAEEDPDKYGDILDQMNRTGKVGGAFRRLRMAKDEQRVFSIEPVQARSECCRCCRLTRGRTR